ncbi:Glucose-1-phosphatase precursor [Serratia odorifera]|uniref:Glucose-1-phosphatase n=1 Tax=Serratia odorifera TaxID=618 RepID=A0A3S4HPZ6_SEROD|nr:Glucose-1-phosphatase precursor [Serratia odorifera]
MKRKTLLLCLPMLFSASALAETEGYQLEQVLVMSRHNLRAPLANNGKRTGERHAAGLASVGYARRPADHQGRGAGSVYGPLF